MKTSIATISAVLLASAFLSRSSARGAAERPPSPTGDENVAFVQSFELPAGHTCSVQAAISTDEGIFVAGDMWSEKKGHDLWLWRISPTGERLWQKKLPRRKKVHEECKVVGLLNRSGGDVHVIVERLGDVAMIDVASDGKIAGDRLLKNIDEPQGVIAIANGDLVFFGSSTSAGADDGKAWIARCDNLGRVRWKRTFDPGQDDLLFSAAELPDRSIAFVGQTGTYNKFGQGPSKLWLLRIDADGKRLAQAFVKDGQIFPASRQLFAVSGEELLVPYTRSQLPPINAVPVDELPAFGSRLARFDLQLKLLSDAESVTTSMPGALSITPGPPVYALSADSEGVLVRSLDARGNEQRRARVAADGVILPVATLVHGEQVTAICEFTPISEEDDGERNYVMLVRLKQQ